MACETNGFGISVANYVSRDIEKNNKFKDNDEGANKEVVYGAKEH